MKLKTNIFCNVIELGWKEVNVNLNGNKINLPTSGTIRFRDKFQIRCIVKREPLLFHIMLKQGMTWFTLVSNKPSETAKDISRYTSRNGLQFSCKLQLPLWILLMQSPRGHNWCESDGLHPTGDSYI